MCHSYHTVEKFNTVKVVLLSLRFFSFFYIFLLGLRNVPFRGQSESQTLGPGVSLTREGGHIPKNSHKSILFKTFHPLVTPEKWGSNGGALGESLGSNPGVTEKLA
jgi:hypothetical protein